MASHARWVLISLLARRAYSGELLRGGMEQDDKT